MDVQSVADAFQQSFLTGDRGPFEALMAPGCVDWHNDDKLEVVSANPDGIRVFKQLVDDLHIDIVQVENFPSGGLIRFVIRGTVRANGRPLESQNCIVLTIGDAGVTRIDSYVDPTFGAQLDPDRS